jgi:predicted lipoprotein with Yx(FWY)xxD motif
VIPSSRFARTVAATLLALGAGFALVACGSSGSGSTSTGTGSSANSGSATVSTQTISGVGDVLVDSGGRALYTNAQDTAGKVACSGACAKIWVPLTVPAGSQPSSGDASVEAKLGVVRNPQGESQVTFEGKPLYSFAPEGPGAATGDGVSDSFGGTSFTWSVATAGPSAGGGSGSSTTSGSSGSYSHGY